MIEDIICGVLACSTGSLLVLFWLACNKSILWQGRCEELLNKPLSFWEHRETMKMLMDRTNLDAFGKVPTTFPQADSNVVRFRRPQPFTAASE